MTVVDWQRTRSPKLADELDAQGPDKAWLRVGKLPGSRAKTAVLNLSKTVDDPRLATLYMTWLAQGNWPAPTAKPVWTRIFEHLVKLRDVRVIEPMRAVAANLPSFVGVAHRAWVVGEIEKTIQALAAVTPTKDVAHRSKPVVKSASADPCAPVWADPDDLDLRQVVADSLGDLQGELITLQLLKTKTPAQRNREKELLAKHGATWLGAIGRIPTAGSYRFEAGFPIAVEGNRRGVHRREWEAALSAPQWATIQRLCVSILQTPHWWITAWVGSPATSRVRAFEIGSLEYKNPAMRIERTNGNWCVTHTVRGYTSSGVPILRAFAAGLPKGVSLTIAPAVKDRDRYLEAIE